MKRLAIFITAFSLLFTTSITAAYAANSESATPAPKKVMFYLKPDISVEMNGVRQVFKDAKNQIVYPIIYNGSTYLPIRAMSALMKEPVEWDSGSKTVYIGKTISHPIKDTALIPVNAAVSAKDDKNTNWGTEPGLVAGYSKPDVLVMYDFVIISCKDVNGGTIYPINYNGSIYLPLRTLSNLMGEPIDWDGEAKKICIGDGEDEPEEDEPIAEEPEIEIDKTAVLFKDLYDREEALYYEATAKITNIKDATTEEKQVIASTASENYLKAGSIALEIKNVDQSDFTEEEKEVYDKLAAFAESNEYYILVLENIAYLAASDSDYSMLAETFLYFAMEAQTKMEAVRESLPRTER
ncbi:MAG: stalk domain-containing protein [Eubacteriales bacterium]|nr:stalk domain-containing protein [Eubacteriales bacterium]